MTFVGPATTWSVATLCLFWVAIAGCLLVFCFCNGLVVAENLVSYACCFCEGQGADACFMSFLSRIVPSVASTKVRCYTMFMYGASPQPFVHQPLLLVPVLFPDRGTSSGMV